MRSINTAYLSSIVDKLMPLSAELSACVRVSLPALVVLGQDALTVTEMQQQSFNGRLSELDASFQLLITACLLSTSTQLFTMSTRLCTPRGWIEMCILLLFHYIFIPGLSCKESNG